MCPPKADEHIEDIGLNSSDEEFIMSLSKMIQGASIPGNVITDVNPFHYLPSDLPDGICFFICSEVRKDTEFGFWKNKGKAIEVLTNFAITGWKTTLEFYEGRDPHVYKTDWVMLVYTVHLEGQSEIRTKGAYCLCKVFCGNRLVEEKKPVTLVDTCEIDLDSAESIDPHSNRIRGQRSIADNDSMVRDNGEDGRLSIPDTVHNDLWGKAANTVDYLSRGDYLELLDLENAVSRSSSENSSCLTMSSDEYFDYLALLHDLEREDGKRDAVCKYNISTTNVANEYIQLPACEGSVVMSHQNSLQTKEVPRRSVGEIIVANEKAHSVKGGPSRISNAIVPSENNSSVWRVEKKVAAYRIKMLKKYLCFM